MAAVMQPYMNRQLISGGVVLVRTKDKIVDLEAFGYSDVANKVPMKTDNVFWIASMSKASTTACLMMLVDEGKVNVNDPVEKYLPEFKGQMVVEANNKEAKLAKKSEKKTDKADEVSIDFFPGLGARDCFVPALPQGIYLRAGQVRFEAALLSRQFR